jgi:hypothetical protein
LQVRDVHNELRGWAGTDTNALLLLTWSAIIKLLEPYVDFGEASVGELQARAFGAGGFGAMADCLQTQVGLPTSTAASLSCVSLSGLSSRTLHLHRQRFVAYSWACAHVHEGGLQSLAWPRRLLQCERVEPLGPIS